MTPRGTVEGRDERDGSGRARAASRNRGADRPRVSREVRRDSSRTRADRSHETTASTNPITRLVVTGGASRKRVRGSADGSPDRTRVPADSKGRRRSKSKRTEERGAGEAADAFAVDAAQRGGAVSHSAARRISGVTTERVLTVSSAPPDGVGRVGDPSRRRVDAHCGRRAPTRIGQVLLLAYPRRDVEPVRADRRPAEERAKRARVLGKRTTVEPDAARLFTQVGQYYSPSSDLVVSVSPGQTPPGGPDSPAYRRREPLPTGSTPRRARPSPSRRTPATPRAVAFLRGEERRERVRADIPRGNGPAARESPVCSRRRLPKDRAAAEEISTAAAIHPQPPPCFSTDTLRRSNA